MTKFAIRKVASFYQRGSGSTHQPSASKKDERSYELKQNIGRGYENDY
jgi:hypothetical protein